MAETPHQIPQTSDRTDVDAARLLNLGDPFAELDRLLALQRQLTATALLLLIALNGPEHGS